MTFSQNLEKIGQHPDIIVIITDQQRATQNFPPGWEEENLPNLTFLNTAYRHLSRAAWSYTNPNSPW
jgi:hypothetical protein